VSAPAKAGKGIQGESVISASVIVTDRGSEIDIASPASPWPEKNPAKLPLTPFGQPGI
jgi:hypothetical protein